MHACIDIDVDRGVGSGREPSIDKGGKKKESLNEQGVPFFPLPPCSCVNRALVRFHDHATGTMIGFETLVYFAPRHRAVQRLSWYRPESLLMLAGQGNGVTVAYVCV